MSGKAMSLKALKGGILIATLVGIDNRSTMDLDTKEYTLILQTQDLGSIQ